MRKTIRVFGIIALVAIIGFSFAACGGDDDSGPKFDGHTLRGGTPSAKTLGEYNLTEGNLQVLFNSANGRAVTFNDADYEGWYEENNSASGMTIKIHAYIWSNKTEKKFEQVCDDLEDELDGYFYDLDSFMANMPAEYQDGYPSDVSYNYGGTYDAGSSGGFGILGKTCTISYFYEDYDGGHGLVPKGTLCVAFSSTDFDFGGFGY